MDIREAGILRPRQGRALEQRKRVGDPLLAHPLQTERMHEARIVRHGLQSVRQRACRVGLATEGPVEVREVRVRRDEVGLETDRRPVFRLRPGRIAPVGVDDAEVEMRLGTLGERLLGRYVLGHGALASRSTLGRKRVHRNAREYPARLDAHGFHGVVGERLGEPASHGGRG